jgi:molybdopterin-binding protein
LGVQLTTTITTSADAKLGIQVGNQASRGGTTVQMVEVMYVRRMEARLKKM